MIECAMLLRKTTDSMETEDGVATVRKGVVDGYIASKATPRCSPRSRNGLVVVPQVQAAASPYYIDCVMIYGRPIRSR